MNDKLRLPTLLIPADVKIYLHCGEKKLYELFNRKDFPSFQIGNKWYIQEDAFLTWIEKQTNKTREISRSIKR